jgi:hypothetical protein
MLTNTYCLSTNGDLGERDKCREAKIPFAHVRGDAITTKVMPATTIPYITVIEARSDAHPTNFLPARSQVLNGICNFYEFATKCTYVAVLFNQLGGSVSLDLLFTVIHILVCVCASTRAAYCSQGKFNLAKPLYQAALEGRTGLLGDLHPSTLTAQHGLALCLVKLGEDTQAETLYRSAA